MSNFNARPVLETVMQEGAPQASVRSWRNSNWLTVFELVLVALIFVADARHLIPLSKTPVLLILGWISLWFRRVGWRGVGLKLYRSWRLTLGLGLLAGLAMEAFELFVSQPILVRWLGKQPDLEMFRAKRSNKDNATRLASSQI